jgi:NAD+ diphosphatase
MKNAELVTFGGSGLNRAAELRGKEADVANETDRTIVLWRGKPLFDLDGSPSLVMLKNTHPILEGAPQYFLGVDAETRIYARDISAWEPPADQHPDPFVFYDPTHQQHPDLPKTHSFVELRGVMAQITPREAELTASAKALFHWHNSHKFCGRCGGETQSAASGWQRNCTACKAPNFPRTDPVVIMLITHGNNVLMGRSHGWPEGMYSLLAGFIEPGETIEAAVRRETFEETGVKVGEVEYLASQPWAFPGSLMLGCRGEATQNAITVDTNEIEDAIWVSKSDMFDAYLGQNPALKPARKGSIAHFIIERWLKDQLG